MATAGTLEYLITINSSAVSSGLNSAESKVKSFGNKLSAWSVAKGQLLGKFIEKAGTATLNFVKSSVQESKSFDKAMSQVAATMGKTVDEIKQLSTFARKMGSETAFTAQQAAEGLNYLALAGFGVKESMDALPSVLNLAAAGSLDLGRAAEMVSQSANALGLQLKNGAPDMERINTLIDQMAATASNSGTNVAQLGDAILTVGANARKLAGGTEELNVLLGVLADNGIQASEGGTALRNIITKISNPANKAAKGLKELGVDVYDSAGNMRLLTDIFADFNSQLSSKSMKERAEIFGEMFDIRDIRSFEALLGTTKQKWDKLYKAVRESSGAAERMKDTQLANLEGDMTILNSAISEAKIAVTEGLTPSLRKLAQIGTKVVQRLTNAFKKNGLKGAIEEAGKILDTTIQTLKDSDSPVLQKLGGALENVKNVASEVWGLITDFPAKIAEWKESDSPGLNMLAEVLSGVKDMVDTIVVAFNQGIPAAVDHLRDLDTPLSNLAAGALETLYNVCSWIADHADIGTVIGSIAAGFAALKGLEISNSLLSFITKLNTLSSAKNLDQIAKVLSGQNPTGAPTTPTTTTTTTTTPTSGGKNKILPFLKWATAIAAGGYVLTKNAFTAQGNDDIFDSEGNITELGQEVGYTQEQAKEILGAQQEIRDATQQMYEQTGLTKEQVNAVKQMAAQINLHKQGSKDFDPKNYEIAWQNFQKAFEGNDSAMREYAKKLNEASIDTKIDFSFFDIDKNGVKIPVMPEVKGGASDIAAQIGTVTIPVTLNVESGIGAGTKPFGQAKGNWTVPYDNYPSLLHRGEMVLNKSQARQFRDGEGSGIDLRGAIDSAIMSAMSRVNFALNGEKVADLTKRRTAKNINAQTYNKMRAMGG